MKTMTKKLGAIILALAMCFSLTCVAFAAEGDYTITVENSIGGATYNAYKVFDATYNEETGAVSYTIDSTNPWYNTVNAATDVFTLIETATTGTYQVTVNSGVSDSAVIAVFEDAYESLTLIAAATGTGTGSEITLDVNEPGYYFVTTTTGSVVSITTAAPTATIVDKNQKPGEGGDIPGEDWPGGFTKDSEEGTSANVGETIDYVIRSYVPTYDGEKQVTDYTFTDTMSAGLTLIDTIPAGETETDGAVHTVLSGVTVKIISSSGEEDSWVDITDACTISVQIEYNGDGSVKDTILIVEYTIENVESKITVNGETFVYPADAVVEISYQDVVNEAADDDDLTNSVAMAWHKVDPSDPDSEPEDGEGKTTDETLYTYGFVLSKVDGNKVNLDGAVFTLKDEDDNTIYFDAKNGGYEMYEENSEYTASTTADIEAGSVYIWGLNEGTYTLTEITAPDGYNLLSEPVTITIAATYQDVLDPDTNEPIGQTQTGWSVSVNGVVVGTATFDENSEHGLATPDDGSSVIPVVSIENNAGSTLPGTGGIGTTIFYIIGGVLVAGAVVVLITRRRMSSAD